MSWFESLKTTFVVIKDKPGQNGRPESCLWGKKQAIVYLRKEEIIESDFTITG